MKLNKLPEAALEYLEMGWSVIPIKGIAYAQGDTEEEKARDSKKPLISWLEFQKRHPTKEEIRRWWKKYPDANVAIVTGKISGIVVVDFDSKEAIEFAKKNNFDKAPLVETKRGYHAYYKYQEGVGNKVNVAGVKLDLRGDGGYVIAPPSKFYPK
tara:strand:+ start:1558 stop:2022 length:465 start_codon:yes stop_codon:yes gene_type:complete